MRKAEWLLMRTLSAVLLVLVVSYIENSVAFAGFVYGSLYGGDANEDRAYVVNNQIRLDDTLFIQAKDAAINAQSSANAAKTSADAAKTEATNAKNSANTAASRVWDTTEGKSAATLAKEARDKANAALTEINDYR